MLKRILFFSGFAFYAYCANPSINHNNFVRTLNGWYKDINGFNINNDEIKFINANDGVDIYGEITPDAVQVLIDNLKPTKNDVFYDLGTGVGKMPVHFYLKSPVKKSVGIELSPTRCNHCKAVLEKIKKQGLLDPQRKLIFLEENILNSDLKDATIIYLASTCFSDEFMKKMLDRFLALKPGLKVISLRKFPKHEKFKEIKEYKLPMTWSTDVPVYVYQLSK